VSFARLVYYRSLLASWAAFAAWVVAEALVFGRLAPSIEPALVGGLVGAGMGWRSMSRPRWARAVGNPSAA
jgi:hypothetical protein